MFKAWLVHYRDKQQNVCIYVIRFAPQLPAFHFPACPKCDMKSCSCEPEDCECPKGATSCPPQGIYNVVISINKSIDIK